MRFVCAIILVVGVAMPIHGEDVQGWSFSGSLNGSSNSDGVVIKAQPATSYTFNNHFQTYVGLPFYFVDISSTATSTAGGFENGIGNAFVGFRLGVDNETLNYSSNLEFTAPTGDKSKGFSTGRVTADWTNRFSHKFTSITPFGSIGVANTISDTAFFVRPFTSLGVVGHFEGGSTYDVSPLVRLGASAYAVRGSGQQRIISKVIKRSVLSGSSQVGGKGNSKNRVFESQTETVAQADIANDHGASVWLGVNPTPEVDFHVGYSRSVNYAFNTLFFGVGFRVGK